MSNYGDHNYGAPGRQGYPKATIGTPKGDRVYHNRTAPSISNVLVISRTGVMNNEINILNYYL